LSELDIASSSRGEVESPKRQNRSGDADSNDASSEGEEDAGEDEDDDDEEGWITPGNIKEKRRLMEGRKEDDAQAHVKVACMTTDYAMQNVLKQLGLNVFSLDGYLIRETRTWNLRCYGCFHVTTEMTRKFCPKCGNKTLKRVAVTRNDDGSKEVRSHFSVHLSTRIHNFPTHF
jgi:RNA-binding protein NOB1